MELTTKQKIIITTVSLAVAFATGRYTVPVKVKTEIKTVEVEKIVYKEKKNTTRKNNKTTTIVEHKTKDGDDTITTVIKDNDDTHTVASSDTTKNDNKQKDDKKEVVKESGHLTISALAGTNITGIPASQGIIYGGEIQRNLIGPSVIGIWGLSNGTCGASLGLEF